MCEFCYVLFFFKQKTAYELRISAWSSDVCSSDLNTDAALRTGSEGVPVARHAGALWPAFRTSEAREPAEHGTRCRCTAEQWTDRQLGSHAPRSQADRTGRGVRYHSPGDRRIRYRQGSRCPCRSEETTSELQSLLRISYAVFCLHK